MEKEDLFEKTGRLLYQIQKFETMLDCCLTCGYAGFLNADVYSEVIQPLGLTQKFKILKKLDKRLKLNFDFTKAERYKEIRNIVIHGQGYDKNISTLKKGVNKLPIKKLFKEFEEIRVPLEKNLEDIMIKIGMIKPEERDPNNVDSYDFPIWS